MRLLLVVLTALPLFAQHAPYKSMQRREIKALSEEQVRGYLEGSGMGLALAAELNGYPGPKHVLELADQIELTADQRGKLESVFERMKKRAMELGAAIVAAEKTLDETFRSGAIDAASLAAQTGTIANLQGELRNAHLAAHLETKALLTSAQIAAYSRLRGYQTDDVRGQHHH